MHHSSQGMYKKNILSKSLNMEVFKSSSSVLLIFFLLVVGSRIVGYFEQAAEGNLDPAIIMSVVALRFPDFITLLIPLSFFLGVLISISRIYADREIYGFFSVGLAPFDLIKFLAPQALLYFLLTLILSLYVAPYTKTLSQEILKIDSFEEQLESIKSDEIVSLNDGGFIYIQNTDNTLLTGVKALKQNQVNSFFVIADELFTTESKELIKLNFNNGSIYNGVFSDSSKLQLNFNEFKLDIKKEKNLTNDMSLTKLFDFSSDSDTASFQWNVSVPITILILLFIGVYISEVKPRQGRFSVILPGMLLYVMYLSLLILGREYIVDNPKTSFGLWYVHLIFILFLFAYLLKDKYAYSGNINLAIRDSLYMKYVLALSLFILMMWVVS
ncbi:MAG: LptF/LptG family permease [Proteobacteria bacterium]|nr:LptF/LptG family permease [Pseudomonadota bacterium]MDA0949333.1 LptF/LptG family permease [Pseudomonadota bacterium]MDA1082995.1 LptF/LptG family permease [Pseudomonadota bacterium]MDC1241462.1 LptF/LptG family permease [Gammaproteobacteria bacterium]